MVLQYFCQGLKKRKLVSEQCNLNIILNVNEAKAPSEAVDR